MCVLTLIATGGTIACRDGQNGLQPQLDGAAFAPFAPAGCRVETVDFARVDSTDLTVEQQWDLADCIASAGGEGVVVTHGTDTLAYTAAVLTHRLAGLGRPVIVTGSQLPLGAPGSDAEGNLALAFRAACGDRAGVWVACNGRLIPGDRVTKAHTSDQAAFVEKGVAYRPAGRPAPRPVPTQALLLYPGMNPELIDAAQCRCLILLTLGMGGIPGELLPALGRKIAAGVRVFALSQCGGGGVDLTRYAVGARAAAMGVRSLPELTVENALALGRCGLL